MQNTGILRKLLEELKKENPSVDYMKGMVETLIEMGDSSAVEQSSYTRPVAGSTPALPTDDDEATILDGKARAAIAAVQAIAAESEHE